MPIFLFEGYGIQHNLFNAVVTLAAAVETKSAPGGTIFINFLIILLMTYATCRYSAFQCRNGIFVL